jgi:hypothetical protein
MIIICKYQRNEAQVIQEIVIVYRPVADEETMT